MPLYVYQCKNNHREDIVFSMTVVGTPREPLMICGLCAEVMWRIPMGGAAVYRNPNDTLYDWCEVNLRRWRKKQPEFSPDHVNNPDGIPGIFGHFRKRKEHAKQASE